VTTALGQLLTTGTEELPAAVEKLLQENKRATKALQNYEKLAEEQDIAELTQQAITNPLVCKCYADKSPDALRRVASAVVKQAQGTFLLGSTGETPCLAFATTNPDLDLRPILKQILPLIEGRGGGSASFVQGGGTNSAGITEALETATGLLR
jgi:alanyl-tRNA synthetase